MNYDVHDLLLSITQFCLGSCTYCNLKDLETFEYDQEWMIFDLEKIMKDPYLDGLQGMHLTGGEPILSPKLWETCKIIKKYHPDIRLNMPVSGFFPYATYRYMKRIHNLLPQLRIDISVDGTTKRIHEKTRGVGSWEPLNKTIELLQTIPDLKLQLQLTLMESNVEQIDPVQEWAKELGVGFFLCFPHYGTRFGHDVDASHEHGESFIEKVERQTKEWQEIRPLNKQTWTCQKAVWEGKAVYHDCTMGLNSLDIDPFGNLYPCMCYHKNQLMGNIKHQTLTEILESEHAHKILERVKYRACQPCLMPVCPWKSNFTIDGEKVLW
jgi:radical SAM protein with 4Fe4S-binding SPASM domain